MKLKYVEQEGNVILKNVLKNKLYISTSLIIKLKKNNVIFVNNNPVFVNKVLNKNDVLTINFDELKLEKDYINCYDFPLDILYEDEYILAVNKPSNLESHPSQSNYDKTLANAVMNYYTENNYNIHKVHILTRLDKDTTGICIIAKNEYIQNLFEIKKEHINLKKEYIAAVNGIIKNDYDVIEKNIIRKSDSIILREVSNFSGDYAKTDYYVLARNLEKNYSLLNIVLHTGRTHQIRVHMASIGHVILR